MSRLVVDVALDRGDFRLSVQGSFDLLGLTAIFGASGSGKTSLLRVIAGLESEDRGQIRFRDQEWLGESRRLPPEARGAGFVFQDGRLFEHLDVRGNLEFGLRPKRPGPIGFDATVAAMGLEPLLGRAPMSLSGGERQRVAIARALLANPVLLLMDEPLSSLDLARKRELLPLIRSLPSRFGLPILYVTHSIDEIAYLADSVVLLAGGRNLAHAARVRFSSAAISRKWPASTSRERFSRRERYGTRTRSPSPRSARTSSACRERMSGPERRSGCASTRAT